MLVSLHFWNNFASFCFWIRFYWSFILLSESAKCILGVLACFAGLRAHVFGVFACLRAWCACVLACLACLRACLLVCLRAYVLTCLRACVLGVLLCVHACYDEMFYFLTCLRTWCMYTWCAFLSYFLCISILKFKNSCSEKFVCFAKLSIFLNL